MYFALRECDFYRHSRKSYVKVNNLKLANKLFLTCFQPFALQWKNVFVKKDVSQQYNGFVRHIKSYISLLKRNTKVLFSLTTKGEHF